MKKNARGRGRPRDVVPARQAGGPDMSLVGSSDGQRQRQLSGCSSTSQLSDDMSTLSMSSGLSSTGGEVLEAILAEKGPKGTRGKRLIVQTNIWELEFNEETKDMPIYRYDLEVDQYFGPAKMVNHKEEYKKKSLSKGPKNDAKATERKQICQKLFEILCFQQKDILGDSRDYVYDRSATLFSPKDLQLKEAQSFTINVTDDIAKKAGLSADCRQVTMKISRCIVEDSFVLGDLAPSIDPDLNKQSRTLRHMLELATNQEAAMGNEHILFGSGKSFLLNASDYGMREISLGEGKYLAVGADKGIRITEGQKNQPTVAMALDSKKAAFSSPNRYWTL